MPTVVIPTIKDEVITTESIPDSVEILIERSGTLNQARNRGVRNASNEKIIIMDDDIRFPEDTFWELVDSIRKGRLVGMEDWNYGLVAGRVMAFHFDDWCGVGGFDERLQSHMGETEFALKFKKHGKEVVTFSQDLFEHEDHERSITAWDHAWRGLYLSLKYPSKTPHLFRGMVFEG